MLEDLPQAQENGFAVFAENWPAFKVFFAVRRQWQTVLMANNHFFYIGIRTEAIAAVIQLLQLTDTERVLNDVNIMEDAALTLLNSQS